MTRPSEPPASKTTRGRLAKWGAVAGVAILAATGALLWQRQASAPAAESGTEVVLGLDRKRVVVLPFANRTGDPELNGVGPMAASHVGSALVRTGRVSVVPPAETHEAAVTAPQTGPKNENLASAVGATTGAQLAVAGSYYLTGGELRLRADVLDLERGDFLWSLAPVAADRSDPEPALTELEQRLMSVVALHVDQPDLRPTLFSHMPLYEVYQEYRTGISVASATDSDSAREHLLRAYQLDPDFVLAGLYLAGSPLQLLGNRHRREGLEELDARRERLTPFERHLLDAFLNQVRGRWEDALLLLRKAERLAPESAWINTQISNSALWLNRPREALEVMEGIPVEEIRDPFARWRRVINRGYALHALGRYEEEAEFAQRGMELLPNLPGESRYAQVRALAAMARLDELERVLEESRADVSPMWEESAWYLLASALQLRAHGHPDQAQEYGRRAVEWYGENGDRKDDERLDDPRIFSWALWLTGRLDEAYENHLRLAADLPNSLLMRAELACLAALRGDREEALRLLAEVAAIDKPDFPGVSLSAQGLIHAHLGDLDRAVELLASGFAAGDNYKEFRVHYHVFLNPLLGYPPYEELVRPKG